MALNRTIGGARAREAKLRHNVVQPHGRRVRLVCGHMTEGEHLVASTVGGPLWWRCPEGCGLVKGHRARAAA